MLVYLHLKIGIQIIKNLQRIKTGPLYIGLMLEVIQKYLLHLAEKISDIVGFKGEIIWDTEKPDGTPRKKLDSSRISKLEWSI